MQQKLNSMINFFIDLIYQCYIELLSNLQQKLISKIQQVSIHLI